MKKKVASIRGEKNSKAFGFELLSEKEMLNVRGGGRPRPRSKDEYDLEEL